MNDGGTFSTTPYANGSYSVEAASGRVSITGLTATPPVVYLTSAGNNDDEIAGFLLGTDLEASAGLFVSQSTAQPAFGLSDITGNYAASTEEDVDGANGATLGAFTFTGAGNYFATLRSTGTVPTLPSTGPIALSFDGSGNLSNGSFPLVTNGDVLFAIPATGDPLLYVPSAPCRTEPWPSPRSLRKRRSSGVCRGARSMLGFLLQRLTRPRALLVPKSLDFTFMRTRKVARGRCRLCARYCPGKGSL